MRNGVGFALSDFLQQIFTVIKTFSIFDIIDVLVVAFLVYEAILLIKETRAAQLVKGLIIYVVAYLLVLLFQMRTMEFIMRYLLTNGLIVLVIVFQPELRRALEQVGRSKISSLGLFSPHAVSENLVRQQWKTAITSICEAASSLSRSQTGALMVVERQTKLGDIIKTGTVIDSDPSMELICNIFYPNTPLHDGATILRDGRLHAAGCFLPLSQNYSISKQLGTRHRAALGMSENSDALVVVVSEETGYISITQSGVLTRNITVDQLRTKLNEAIFNAEEEQGEKKSGFWRSKKQ